MEYKPSDFPVGVVDFFSTLLPGAFLCYLSRDAADKYVFGATFPAIKTEAEGWVVFVLASYLVGQFVALMGAAFMDWVYDHTYLKYKRRGGDQRYIKARELQGTYQRVSTTLQWASAYVRLKSADASHDIDHFEAGSKFFRSIVVVLIIAIVVLLYRKNWTSLAACLVLLLLSFWRFAHLRWKFSELAFVYFVELNVYPESARKDTV